MKERFTRHLSSYRKAKIESEKTGFGITDEDRAKGINTIDAKLEHKCMCFDKMDQLFGCRPNITPLVVHSSTSGKKRAKLDSNRERELAAFDDNIEADFNEFVTEFEEEPVVCEKEIADIAIVTNPNNRRSDDEESEPSERSSQSRPASIRSRAKDPRKAPPRLDTGAVIKGKSQQLEFLECTLDQMKEGTMTSKKRDKIKRKKRPNFLMLFVLLEENASTKYLIDFKKKELEQQVAREDKQAELETKKLEWEKEKWEKESKAKKNERAFAVAMAVLEKGRPLDEVQKLLELMKVLTAEP